MRYACAESKCVYLVYASLQNSCPCASGKSALATVMQCFLVFLGLVTINEIELCVTVSVTDSILVVFFCLGLWSQVGGPFRA